MDTKQLRDELAKGKRLLKMYENADDVAAKLEGMEQTIKETEARVKALKAEEGTLSDLKSRSVDAATEIKKTASETAKKTIEDAIARASTLIAAAESQAKLLKDVSEKEIDDLSLIANELTTKNNIAAASLKEKLAEFDEISAAVEQHKAGIAKFLKG